VSVEVSKEGRVREVKKAGSRIGHDVGCPWDEGEFGAVAVMALMFTGALAQVGGSARGGRGPFEHAGQCGGVVGERSDGLLSDVEQCGDDVQVGKRGKLLQVAVGDIAVGIGVGHQAALQRWW
jgi:hypothetical protein